VCVGSWRTGGLGHERGDQPRDEEKRPPHQYPLPPMNLRGHRLDSHNAAKRGCPRGRVKGGISYEDVIYFYQVVSTLMVEQGLVLSIAPPRLSRLSL
jgi:hypothetical protein